MRKYIGKRILFLFLLVWMVCSITFFLIRLVPGDPVEYLMGSRANLEDIKRFRDGLDLERPLWSQFIGFQRRILCLDFGRSIFNGKKVLSNIFYYLPNTLLLSLTAMFIAIMVSFPIGTFAAFRMDSFFDLSFTGLSSLGLSMPNFILGTLLIYIFSILLGWLPVSGSAGIKYLILPSLTLGLSISALLSRIIKVAVKMELSKPYVLLARSKGLSKSQVFFRHVLKNALPVIIAAMGLLLGALLTGTIITETIFSWEGIGCLLIKSVYRRDYPMIQGLVIVMTILYLSVNLVADVFLIVINPKLRYEICG